MDLAKPKLGEGIWRDFNERLKDRIWKAFGILPEGYTLFKKAVESYDAGAFEGSVLLCRATLESAFLIFLSIEWHDEHSFNIAYPTTLDGKARLVGFDELRNAIRQRVSFSKDQMAAIDRIHQDGNFIAHLAGRKIKQRLLRVEKYERWEVSHKSTTDLERVREVHRLVKSEPARITPDAALQDLLDTASIMLTLGKAVFP